MAGTTVTTTIRIVGEDRASAEIAKVKKSLHETADATREAAEKSGDIEKGFRGLKDIVGQLGAGPLQEIGDRFGGIENLIKGFGPALGPVAIGVAAIGAGVAYWYDQQEKARVSALKTQIASIEAQSKDIEARAKSLNISAEVLGFSTKQLTADEAIAAGQKDLASLDEKRKALLEARISKEKEKIPPLEREIALLGQAIQMDQIRLDAAKERATSVMFSDADAKRAATQEAVNQAAINGILDARTRINKQHEDIEAKKWVLAASERRVLTEIRAGTGDRLALEKELNEIVTKRLALGDREKAIEAEAAQLLADKQAKRKAAHEKAVADAKTARDLRLAWIDAEAAAADKAESAAQDKRKAMTAERIETAKQEHDAAQAARVSVQTVTVDPAEKARLQLVEIEIEQTLQLDQIRANATINEATRQAQLLALEQESNGKRLAILTSEQQRKDAAAKAEIDNGFAIAKAGLSALEQLGIGRQALDGLRAAESAAEALYQASIGNIPGAIAAGAAAVQFGIAAGTSTPQVGAAGGGGGFASQTAQIGASQGGGGSGGAPIVINFGKGFVVGTAQDVGKAVNKAIKSISATGYPQKQAA